jgi:putative flippase GtrA
MEIIRKILNHHLVRYVFSGGIAAVINLGLLYILTEYAGLHYLVSGVIAFCCAVIVSFSMQKKWTFQDHSTHATHKKFGIFVVVALINLGLNTLLLYLFTDLAKFHYIVSQILAAAIVALWSYFIYKKVVFRPTVGYDISHEASHNDPETR